MSCQCSLLRCLSGQGKQKSGQSPAHSGTLCLIQWLCDKHIQAHSLSWQSSGHVTPIITCHYTSLGHWLTQELNLGIWQCCRSQKMQCFVLREPISGNKILNLNFCRDHRIITMWMWLLTNKIDDCTRFNYRYWCRIPWNGKVNLNILWVGNSVNKDLREREIAYILYANIKHNITIGDDCAYLINHHQQVGYRCNRWQAKVLPLPNL